MESKAVAPSVFGLLAEFDTAEELTEATKKTISNGYKKLEAYCPMPVEDLAEIMLNFKKGGFNSLPLIILAGGALGALTAYAMQYWMTVIDYPINIGGRPLHSWPAFIVVLFELTVLFSSFAAVFGMIILNGLPLLYHPVFDAPGFDRASSDKFFLCIEAKDSKFELEETKQFLESLKPKNVVEVPPSRDPDV